MAGLSEKRGVSLRRCLWPVLIVLLLAGCGAATSGTASSGLPVASQGSADVSLDTAEDLQNPPSGTPVGAVSEFEAPPSPPETAGEPETVAEPDKSQTEPDKSQTEPDKGQTKPERTERNDAYFDNTLFIGDSIMEGIRQYVAAERKERKTLGNAKFLTSVMGIALADLVGDRDIGLRYNYKGKDAPLEDLVADIAPQRVFLLLGLNDLSAADPSVEESVERYGRLIDNLEAMLPEGEVVVLTSPPKVASNWLPNYTANRNFNNELIEEFNLALIELCEQRGTPYLDIHGHLANKAGALPDDYCRDGYIHLSNAGSKVVVNALYGFAEGQE